MEKRAFRRAVALGTVLQVLMVLLGLAVPSLEQENLYPIVGTLLALLAGFLFARWAPGSTFKPALVGGALAGGLSSLVGVLLVALTGPADASTVLVATVTGFVAGGIGGFFGRLFGQARVSAPRTR
jgi:hypothetical protein